MILIYIIIIKWIIKQNTKKKKKNIYIYIYNNNISFEYD